MAVLTRSRQRLKTNETASLAVADSFEIDLTTVQFKEGMPTIAGV